MPPISFPDNSSPVNQRAPAIQLLSHCHLVMRDTPRVAKSPPSFNRNARGASQHNTRDQCTEYISQTTSSLVNKLFHHPWTDNIFSYNLAHHEFRTLPRRVSGRRARPLTLPHHRPPSPIIKVTPVLTARTNHLAVEPPLSKCLWKPGQK